jgi:hypothetical protein
VANPTMYHSSNNNISNRKVERRGERERRDETERGEEEKEMEIESSAPSPGQAVGGESRPTLHHVTIWPYVQNIEFSFETDMNRFICVARSSC